jgi:anti-anti-sigma factor
MKESSWVGSAIVADDQGTPMPELTFDITPDGPSRVVIAVAGEVDMATAPSLADCLADNADRDVILDLSGVAFLDSSGLTALINAHRALREAGHTLRTTGERDNVLKVLQIADLTSILHDDSDS